MDAPITQKAAKPPKTLAAAGKKYWLLLTAQFSFDDSDLPLVENLCVLVDRAAELRAAIAKAGVVTPDRFGVEKPNPALEHERSTILAAARVWRELGLGSADQTDPVKLPLNRRCYR